MEATDLGRRLALGFTGSLYRICLKYVVLHDFHNTLRLGNVVIPSPF